MTDTLRTLARYQIAQMKKPSGRVTGEHLIVAVPNDAQWNPGAHCYEQSFRPKYRICESGGYPEGTLSDATNGTLVRLLAKYADWHKLRY